jgi:hypothetical protein
MTFTEILPFLNEGFAVRRECYCPELIIFKQIPASIDDVTHMKSIPTHVKQLMLKLQVGIDYQDQYIIYDFVTGIGTYCVFDGDDINAEDWMVVYEDYNPYE